MISLLFILNILIKISYVPFGVIFFALEQLHYLSPYSQQVQANRRSKAIDQALKEDAAARNKQYNVLPLGAFSMHEIIQQLKPIPTPDNPYHQSKAQGATSHQFVTNGRTLNFIDVGLQRCERRKWFHHFDNVAAILFVVDLECYDQELSTGNVLASHIELFDSVVNSGRFEKTVFTVFLSNVAVFRRKLVESPLETFFQDYAGREVEGAEEYLRWRFMEVNRSRRKLAVHFVDPYEVSNVQLVAVE